jgi:hypothetical protein
MKNMAIPLTDTFSFLVRMKYIAAGIALLMVVLVLVPLPIKVSRSCIITVVDENGKPWKNAKVRRGWAYGSEEKFEDGFTGSDGVARFAPRVQEHSLLSRCLVSTLGVFVVHGGAHIEEAYGITLPTNYTAEIQSDAGFKWVYDEGHFAEVDFQDLPRNHACQAKFILKKKDP